MFKRLSIFGAIILALVIPSAAYAGGAFDPVRINFLPGTSTYTFTTNLVAGVPQEYVLTILAGQTLYITKNGSATTQVIDAQGNALTGTSAQPGPYGVTISQTGDYVIALAGNGMTTVSLYIPPFGAPNVPAAPTTALAAPINFTPGSSGTSFTANLTQGFPLIYSLQIFAQQQVYVVTDGNATVALIDPHRNALTAVAPTRGKWNYAITQTGAYALVLLGDGQTHVSISIPPISVTPTVTPARISFAPGTASYSFVANLAPGAPQQYALRVVAGQTMYVTMNPAGTVVVFDPQDNVVTPVTMPGQLAFPVAQSGDYVIQIAGSGPAMTTIYVPPIWYWY